MTKSAKVPLPYVANRFVVPEIDAAQQAQFAAGTLRLDTLTRQYIHEHLEYQYLVLERSAEAYALERLCRCGFSNNALISIRTKQRQQLLICLYWTQYSVNRINDVAFFVMQD